MRLSIHRVWIGACISIFVCGCGSSTSPDAKDAKTLPANFGRFEGDVVAVWDADGRNMTLREPFTFIDAQERRWEAPAGAVVNGASIPRLFWTVIGGPFEGRYRNASVVHDVGCAEMRHSWEDVHRMFYEACRCGGVDEAKAKIMYYAVHHFGPRWQPFTETVVQQVATADGRVVDQEVTVERIVRIDPLPPTPEEVEQVVAYVTEDDPEPVALQQLDRESLHRRAKRGPRNGSPRAVGDGETVPGERASRGRDHAALDDSSRSTDPSETPGRTPPSRNPAKVGDAPRGSALTAEDQQRVKGIVQEHLQQLGGGDRPAEYEVLRSRGGFLVRVQFLHEDDQGQLVPFEGGTSTVRVSREGQVVEVFSGLEPADVVDSSPSSLPDNGKLDEVRGKRK